MDHPECIFCNIQNPNLVITNTSDGIAMIYPEPVRPGHVVVGVKQHKQYLHDISEDEARKMFALANRMAKAIVEMTRAEKVYVVGVGDGDKHFHVHLIPKMPNDAKLGPYIFGEKGWAASVGSKFEAAEIAKYVKALKQKV